MAWRVAGNFSNSFATRMRPLSLWESPHKTSAAMVDTNTTMSATNQWRPKRPPWKTTRLSTSPRCCRRFSKMGKIQMTVNAKMMLITHKAQLGSQLRFVVSRTIAARCRNTSQGCAAALGAARCLAHAHHPRRHRREMLLSPASIPKGFHQLPSANTLRRIRAELRFGPIFRKHVHCFVGLHACSEHGCHA